MYMYMYIYIFKLIFPAINVVAVSAVKSEVLQTPCEEIRATNQKNIVASHITTNISI